MTVDAAVRMPFDLRLVEPFVVLADEGLRFPAAAQRLGIGASGLSRQIARLQQELGTTLLGRDGRSHVLTPAGERFLAHARVIQGRLAALDSRGPLAAGTSLRIHIGPAIMPAIEAAIAAYMTANPEIEVDVVQGQDTDPIEGMLARPSDVAITLRGSGPLGSEFRLLDVSRLGVLTCDTHPFAARPSVSWQDVSGEPLLIAESRGAKHWNAMLRGCFARHGVTVHPIAGSVVSLPQYHLPAVRRGVASVILPRSFCEPVQPGFAWTLLTPEEVSEVGAIWVPGRSDGAIRAFADFAVAELFPP